MSISEDQVQLFSKLISDLYDQILLGDLPEDSAYRGFLDRETPFGLNEQGYRVSYLGLLQQVFQLPNIAEKWSEDGIQELGHELLLNLAESKNKRSIPQDFTALARDWLEKIDIEFDRYFCYSVVSGLKVDNQIDIGNVTFLPLDTTIPEFTDELAKRFLKNLNEYRDCISFSEVNAEWRRASEIHRQETEISLNVLRYISSLIWHDQPTRHAYVEGHNPKRVSRTLVVSSEGAVSSVGTSEFGPHPIDLRDEMLPCAEFYGFSDIQALVKKSDPSELEQSFLTAVQWFGQATQELLPLVAFAKYYISIETALKKYSEHARSHLPRRLGTLIEPWDKSRLTTLEEDLNDFIDERNSVFHSGNPIKASPDELQWWSRIMSRQALHQLFQRMKREKWQTKDDIIKWVEDQHRKYLS